MYITKASATNFRLLKDNKSTVALNENTTIIVGRNNSGKTSFIEIFYKFFSGKDSFRFEDFSIDVMKEFENALELYKSYKECHEKCEIKEDTEKFREKFVSIIPKISLKIHIDYTVKDNISVLRPFFLDLNPDNYEVIILMEYAVKEPEKLYKDILTSGKTTLDYLSKNHRKYFEISLSSIKLDDKGKIIDQAKVSKNDIGSIFSTKYIYAQRELDDQSNSKCHNLSKLFESYFKNHSAESSDITEDLSNLLDNYNDEIGKQYKIIFKEYLDKLKIFGYPGLRDRELKLKSELSAENILRGSTKLYYQQNSQMDLPEAYNGLGFSNLIYIICQILSFYAEFQEENSKFQVLFIEEPEAHLHPQMQYSFIKNVQKFINENKWPIQIVITTHSSHIVAESDFELIRYFDISKGNHVEVKNLAEFKIENDTNRETQKFLSQYLSLTCSELFFADKIILVEGITEKLLLPLMIDKFDEHNQKNLNSQYISMFEVGGAYAYKFKELLKFINVKTLIITDFDSVFLNNSRWKACQVKTGTKTSNKTLKEWLPKKETKDELLNCSENEKIDQNIKVVYQIPEEAGFDCGRSLEEALILKNPEIFINHKSSFLSLEDNLDDYSTEQEIKESAYEIASKVTNKTDFSLDLIMIGSDKWHTPKYIQDGLTWIEQ
ncbi:MAG: hypothetical protein ACD_20C00124G0010 [uncultured bacterium]|nr:MAG: hypothetical protein ACD_20C00124G0010 [uncultured bacterium]